jgi:hypothetical protein
MLALGDRDLAAYAWAKEYLPVAQQNRAMLGPYGVIQDRIAEGDTEKARELLQKLWSQAPYFRDPANIAPRLDLTLPSTYLHDKAITETSNFEQAWKVVRDVCLNLDHKQTQSKVLTISIR